MQFRRTSVLFLAVLSLISCSDRAGSIAGELSKSSELLERGEIQEASESLVRLREKAEKANLPEDASLCLYHLATIDLNQRDTLGMQRELAEMRRLAEANPASLSINYDYYSVLQVYYVSMYEYTGCEAYRDSSLAAGRRAVGFMEKMTRGQLSSRQVNPVWNYYNIAVSYDLYFAEPPVDSIEFYLAKAEDANNRIMRRDTLRFMQGRISTGDLRAWLQFYRGQNAEAEATMLNVLATIDSVEAVMPYTVLTEKGEAYDFLAQLYEAEGNTDKTLKYLKLRNENDRERFDVERNKAVREIQAKYDLSRKEVQLVRQRRWIVIVVGLLIIALLAWVIVYMRLRRIRLEKDVEIWLEKSANEPLSVTEKKYMHYFLLGTAPAQIAKEMHVETASVYSMKYRLKKKFPEGFNFPF